MDDLCSWIHRGGGYLAAEQRANPVPDSAPSTWWRAAYHRLLIGRSRRGVHEIGFGPAPGIVTSSHPSEWLDQGGASPSRLANQLRHIGFCCNRLEVPRRIPRAPRLTHTSARADPEGGYGTAGQPAA